jgi:hypothetical protein
MWNRYEAVGVFLTLLCRWLTFTYRNSAIPGGAERALSSAAGIQRIMGLSVLVGGVSATLMLVYRTFIRTSGSAAMSWSQWLPWLFSRHSS